MRAGGGLTPTLRWLKTHKPIKLENLREQLIMERPKLDKEDSSDLGFAQDCLLAGAITFEEFKNWLWYLIAEYDDLPTYVFDLIDLKWEDRSSLGKFDTFGFMPYWEHEPGQAEAVSGIAFSRFSDAPSDFISKEEALAALSEHPEILERFKSSFPFIEISL